MDWRCLDTCAPRFPDLQLISNIYGKTRTPSSIRKLSQLAYQSTVGDFRHKDHLSILRASLCDLHSSVKNNHLTDPVSIIEAALALDAKLIAWTLTLPPSWSPTTVNVSPRNRNGSEFSIYGDYYYIYQDLPTSNVWNNYRATRYTLHEMIIDQLPRLHSSNSSHLASDYANLGANSEAIMKHIAEDICASVPYHIGVTGKHSLKPELNFSNNSRPAAGGYILTWHLFLAASCRFSPPSLKSWAITCMEKIGHSMGVNQALSMACYLARGMGPPYRNERMLVIDIGTEVDAMSNISPVV
ncbi:C6 finger domain protein [Aspergillus sclerotialis]|uniref:C6 finger domain protein n=1 Tax=Aspergillus sclerotialis TaxID=2070753 RepID=A0A3A2ZZX3_9EURO|nr:C6 finger domain protein [Aspergillus sclerotialis]